MKNKKVLTLTILGLLSLIVITVGVTYAFFSYTKEGTTENSITTGTITFLYTEVSGVGRGISIDDAYPISDSVGKAQTGEGKVFDFKVTSTTQMNASIPYEVTARKKSDSTLDESAVKLYLTKVDGTEEEVLLDNYSNLTQTDKIASSKYTEKTIYTGKVPANSTNYEQNFKLRMWIDEEVDFSQNEDGTYPYNDKTFTVIVNVYANAKVVTAEEIELESSTEINNISAGDVKLTPVENQDYDYETTLEEGTTSTTINIETKNPNATVEVERIDSLTYETSSIKRLSTQKTLELNPGDNYFKVTIISENKEVENKYIIKIKVNPKIELTGFAKTIYNASTLIDAKPTLTTSSNNTTDSSGLYKSTATNSGEPTYYFRGNVENNYVDFAGFTWRIVRINEDGTIRIVLQDVINDTEVLFNSDNTSMDDLYYSNSDVIKPQLEDWYQENIVNKGYSDSVVSGDYYCEQAKVGYYSSYHVNSVANMIQYNFYTEPNFMCSDDINGYGLVNASVGLLSYDEVLHAGGYYSKTNSSYYLYNNEPWWTMSPSGFFGSLANVWVSYNSGSIQSLNVSYDSHIRPVINLKTDTTVTGSGTSESHWVVQ